jgi:hypothetical protein
MAAGKQRAVSTLNSAARLSVDGGAVKVLNLTGHKLISGYPEGRRMWLRMTWLDAAEQVVRVDGEYGALQLQMDITGDGQVDASDSIRTILDLDAAHTRIYEAHGGISQAWASSLVTLLDPDLPVAYDRETGAVTATLADVASQPAGTAHESFHFALNDTILADNRIPPWRMNRETARQRNTLPVPASQYGDPGPTGVYDHFDRVPLDPPPLAESVVIELLYQPTSWEYIQFLYLANDGQNAFLGDTGVNLLDAWRNAGAAGTRMAEPHVMASTVHVLPEPGPGLALAAGALLVATLRRSRATSRTAVCDRI